MTHSPTCPKCHRPVNEGNSPNAAECHETDDDEGVCKAYALVAALRSEVEQAQEALAEADDDCARHNLYTVEESLRASRAISAAEGYEGPHTVFASMHDRIWWLEAQKEVARLRAALEDISTTAHCLAKAGPLSTPTLNAAWGHFMDIDVKATVALRPNP